MGHAGIGIIHPSTAPGDCPGGRGFGQEFDSPHLHQKRKNITSVLQTVIADAINSYGGYIIAFQNV